MWIKEQLEELELQKQQLKINWFCNLKCPIDFNHNWIDIKIISISDNLDLTLKVIAEFNWNIEDIFFRNPPILVPDWTFREEIREDWEKIKVSNFKEDLESSLKEIVWQVILTK